MNEKFLLISCFAITVITANAQTYGDSCANPRPLGQGDTCLYNISVGASEYWLSFIPDSSSVQITLANHAIGNVGHVHQLVAYASCAPQSAMDTADVNANDSIYLTLNNLIPGNTYFIAAYTLIPACSALVCNSTANFDLCVKNISPVPFVTRMMAT